MAKLSKIEKQKLRDEKHQAHFLKQKTRNLNQLTVKIKNLKTKQTTAKNEKAIVKSQTLIELNEQKYRLLNDQQKFDPETLSSFIMKRWFYGVGKEFLRIDWATRKKVFINFVIIIIVVAFFALLFLGVDSILVPLMKTNPQAPATA
ncbi:MAG: preprotein translocase subunit SecE [Mycoplasmataceae bacterium]|nr:preprotein translocase subunit SecE [Mycoplasmataceae bacterium]